MNKKKTLASFLVVCMLIMNMSTMVVNAATENGMPQASIIISNKPASTGIALTGKTFDVYKVFDATVSGIVISYTVNAAFKDFFISKNCVGDTGELDQEKAEAYIHAQVTTEKRTDLATELRTEALGKGSIIKVTTISGTVGGSGSEEHMTSELLDPGYYLIVDTSTNSSTMSASMLVSLPGKSGTGEFTENVTIDLKGSQPEINKQVWHNELPNNGTDNSPSNDKDGTMVSETVGAWDTVADYEIGDIVEYRITATIPTDIRGYDNYEYVISDTLSDGITFNSGSLKIYTDAALTVGVANANHDEKYNLSDGSTFKLTFNMIGIKEVFPQLDKFYIYYTGTVSDTANLALDKETNTVSLEYSNNPYEATSKGKDSAEVETYTFALDVKKTDSSKETVLSGAKFALYAKSATEGGSDTQIYLKETEGTNVYVVSQTGTPDEASEAGYIVTDATGKFTINGLDDAITYIIREVDAPDGYTKADDVLFKITANYNSGTPTIESSNPDVTVKDGKLSTIIVNTSSSLFPGTGGNGTIIFIVTGSVLMLVAVAFLLVGRRKQERRNRR